MSILSYFRLYSRSICYYESANTTKNKRIVRKIAVYTISFSARCSAGSSNGTQGFSFIISLNADDFDFDAADAVTPLATHGQQQQPQFSEVLLGIVYDTDHEGARQYPKAENTFPSTVVAPFLNRILYGGDLKPYR